MSDRNSGQCNCGAVSFTTRGPLRGVIACHCSQCRRQSGLYYAATSVADANITIEGGEAITWYAGSHFAKRGFCSRCGSALFWKMDGSDTVSVLAGAFDQPSGLAITAHIFTADKADFYTIADGLPQFERSSPDVAVAPDEDHASNKS